MKSNYLLYKCETGEFLSGKYLLFLKYMFFQEERTSQGLAYVRSLVPSQPRKPKPERRCLRLCATSAVKVCAYRLVHRSFTVGARYFLRQTEFTSGWRARTPKGCDA